MACQRVVATITEENDQPILHYHDVTGRVIRHCWLKEMSFDEYQDWLEKYENRTV